MVNLNTTLVVAEEVDIVLLVLVEAVVLELVEMVELVIVVTMEKHLDRMGCPTLDLVVVELDLSMQMDQVVQMEL